MSPTTCWVSTTKQEDFGGCWRCWAEKMRLALRYPDRSPVLELGFPNISAKLFGKDGFDCRASTKRRAALVFADECEVARCACDDGGLAAFHHGRCRSRRSAHPVARSLLSMRKACSRRTSVWADRANLFFIRRAATANVIAKMALGIASTTR